MSFVTVIGGGLAGCEASYQLAKRGVRVKLYEMRPVRNTEAHKTNDLCELVCSNSLKSDDGGTSHGLLKSEMRLLDSLIIKCADLSKVPAGTALAVDREKFSKLIESSLTELGVEIIREEVKTIPKDGVVIIASGPLTSDSLSEKIQELLGEDNLYFYDAISPIVYKDSINFDIAFMGSRYGKGGDDYINCPMNKEEYDHFYNELTNGKQVVLKEFEKKVSYFSGCMPIEELASKGEKTLTFGPMKPVGFIDPRTKDTPYTYHKRSGEEVVEMGRRPWAIVQLRAENLAGTAYNIVGFQTRLKYPEQKRIFRLIPGMENAEFARLGSIHRNSYIDSPRLLEPTMGLRGSENIFFAGQLTGVEGYTESALSGLLSGINAYKVFTNNDTLVLPEGTMSGALFSYITDDMFQGGTGRAKKFQPMNVNFGLLSGGSSKVMRQALAEKSLEVLTKWKDKYLASSEGI